MGRLPTSSGSRVCIWDLLRALIVCHGRSGTLERVVGILGTSSAADIHPARCEHGVADEGEPLR